MLTVIYFVSLFLCLAALVWLLGKNLRRIWGAEQGARDHYEQRFGSLDAMLLLSEVDRDRLREMRDKGRLERWDAIRDVMRQEQVPEEIATEFVDRL